MKTNLEKLRYAVSSAQSRLVRGESHEIPQVPYDELLAVIEEAMQSRKMIQAVFRLNEKDISNYDWRKSATTILVAHDRLIEKFGPAAAPETVAEPVADSSLDNYTAAR